MKQLISISNFIIVTIVLILHLIILLNNCSNKIYSSSFSRQTKDKLNNNKSFESISDKNFMIIEDSAKYCCKKFLKLKENDTIVLFLPNNIKFKCIIEKRKTNFNQTISLRASILGYKTGFVLITINNCNILGIIRIPEVSIAYKINADTDKEYFLFKPIDNTNIIQRDSLLIPDY